jgi:hypothetical protein
MDSVHGLRAFEANVGRLGVTIAANDDAIRSDARVPYRWISKVALAYEARKDAGAPEARSLDANRGEPPGLYERGLARASDSSCILALAIIGRPRDHVAILRLLAFPTLRPEPAGRPGGPIAGRIRLRNPGGKVSSA